MTLSSSCPALSYCLARTGLQLPQENAEEPRSGDFLFTQPLLLCNKPAGSLKVPQGQALRCDLGQLPGSSLPVEAGTPPVVSSGASRAAAWEPRRRQLFRKGQGELENRAVPD